MQKPAELSGRKRVAILPISGRFFASAIKFINLLTKLLQVYFRFYPEATIVNPAPVPKP
ncbi:MAG: hypothetical protein MZV64_41530 [Ignavibacteriales bacterium]|nr:hypothetical protein [Ignavibacteriales bacterium]